MQAPHRKSISVSGIPTVKQRDSANYSATMFYMFTYLWDMIFVMHLEGSKLVKKNL